MAIHPLDQRFDSSPFSLHVKVPLGKIQKKMNWNKNEEKGGKRNENERLERLQKLEKLYIRTRPFTTG